MLLAIVQVEPVFSFAGDTDDLVRETPNNVPAATEATINNKQQVVIVLIPSKQCLILFNIIRARGRRLAIFVVEMMKI